MDFNPKEMAAAAVKSGRSLATYMPAELYGASNIKIEQLHAELCIFFAGGSGRSLLFRVDFIWSCYIGESPYRKA